MYACMFACMYENASVCVCMYRSWPPGYYRWSINAFSWHRQRIGHSSDSVPSFDEPYIGMRWVAEVAPHRVGMLGETLFVHCQVHACLCQVCSPYVSVCLNALNGLALPRASHTGEIALSGLRRLRSTLAAAPVRFAQTVFNAILRKLTLTDFCDAEKQQQLSDCYTHAVTCSLSVAVHKATHVKA